MTLDEYIHKHLIKTDEWYKSINPETQEKFLQQYKKTVYGLRVILEYLIDRYIRRIV